MNLNDRAIIEMKVIDDQIIWSKYELTVMKPMSPPKKLNKSK